MVGNPSTPLLVMTTTLAYSLGLHLVAFVSSHNGVVGVDATTAAVDVDADAAAAVVVEEVHGRRRKRRTQRRHKNLRHQTSSAIHDLSDHSSVLRKDDRDEDDEDEEEEEHYYRMQKPQQSRQQQQQQQRKRDRSRITIPEQSKTAAAIAEIIKIEAAERREQQKRRTTTKRNPCISRGWHASLTTTTSDDYGCTNNDQYPNEWTANLELARRMFFDSPEECCQKLYYDRDRECQVIYDDDCQIVKPEDAIDDDDGAGIASANSADAVTLAESKKPLVESKPIMAESKKSTAAEFKSTSSSNNGPSCTWHPSLTTSHYACDYSDAYPAAWDNPQWSHMYLYDSHGECCRGAFDTPDCGRTVVCETEEPTMAPTVQVTSAAPTSKPTSTPTATPKTYFIEHFSGECYDTAIHHMPHYITTTYDNFDTCCEASFATAWCFEQQVVEDGNNGGTTPSPTTYDPTYLPTTYSPTMTIYYVEHFTGKCLDHADVPMPFWVAKNETKQFNDYDDCCEASFAREECLGDVPASDPTTVPTEYVSPNPTELPTSLPSLQPSVPTARPTEGDCSDSKWRYDTDYVNGCTNLDTDEREGSVLLYQSWQECCQLFFARGEDCQVDDRCQMEPNIVLVQDGPRIATYCESHARYHPDIRNKDGCTNSLDYPESWNSARGNLFFATDVQCCEEVYFPLGYDCNVRNVCAVVSDDDGSSALTVTAEKYASCKDWPWHPRTDIDPVTGFANDGCSNSEEFPDRWNGDESMLFDSAQDCCEAHYLLYGLECNVLNACDTSDAHDDTSSSSSCNSTKWHPTMGGSGAGSDASCSNDWNFPSQWNSPGLSAYMMFDDFSDCCEKHFPDVAPSCRKDDICVEGGGALASTSTVTASPTVSVAPTSSCPSAKWHPSQDFSRCTNAFDYPTSWEGSSVMFDDVTMCCLNIFNYENCEIEDICPNEDVASSQGPSTKTPSFEPVIATMAPTFTAGTADDSESSNFCSGRTQSECRVRLCAWDTSRGKCALFGELSDSSSSPSPAPMETKQCGEMRKKECVKHPDCVWNKDHCVASDEITHRNGCEGKMYHPRNANDRTCSNDDDYPDLWNNPSEIGRHFFLTAEECCAAFYGEGSCNIDDICST